jgi:hypothetical protein
MLNTNKYMVNLNEQILPSLAIEQAVSMIAAICPYQDKECVFKENVEVTPSENGTGWFFECKICEGAKCTGFFRDDG